MGMRRKKKQKLMPLPPAFRKEGHYEKAKRFHSVGVGVGIEHMTS